jgi:hypothetical protein
MEIRRRMLRNDDRFDMPAVESSVWEFGSGEAITTFGERQIILDGAITIGHNRSQKWGEQLEIEIYSNTFREHPRYRSKSYGVWHRAEIFMPVDHVAPMLDVLNQIRKPVSLLDDEAFLRYLGNRMLKGDRLELLAKLNKLLHEHGYGIW